MQLKPIHQQVVAILGGSSGIGRETALEFAQKGAKLIVSARNEAGLKTLVEEITRLGGTADYIVADVSVFDQVKAVADKAVQLYGRLDTWVHAAAVNLYTTFEQTTPEEFQRVVEVNLMGQVYGAMAALPHLKREGRGALIHVSSVEARRAFPYHSAYAASKHGIDGFLESLRVELLHEHIPISVTNVMPASINTPLFNKSRSKIGVKPPQCCHLAECPPSSKVGSDRHSRSNRFVCFSNPLNFYERAITMVAALDDTKRIAIAMQLAEMKALQNLLISNDQWLLNAIEDDMIRQRLQEILEQDQQNLGVLDAVMIQYSVQAESEDTVQQNLDTIQSLMEGSTLTLSEKVLQQELLKHRQVMAGLVVHKAAQVVGADVEVAIAPLHPINFENRAHQEQLRGTSEILGVRELTGQDPDQSVWARTEDAIAALTGVVGSVVTRTDDEMSIRDVLLMDHSKTDILFAEILGSDNPQKIQEYFGQLYQDVKVHGLAEEQTLYPALHSYYEQMQAIIDQTDDVIEMLDEMKLLDLAAPDFKAQVEQLRLAVRGHIDQEESDIFPRMREHLSHEQQK
jgi:NAD(P)-dependent dehydrogenase (short-subunit alcohol dehydrogenase family)/hemerythrin superfamily protein